MKTVPMMFTNTAQLHINGGTITHQLKKTIMEERVQMNHKKYLCTKHNWDSSRFKDIAWEAHHRALNQLQQKKLIMTKYVNGIVPVGKVVNRYDKKYAINCPSCAEATETQDHLIICPNPKREVWRKNLIAQLKMVMDKYSAPPELTNLLLDGTKQAMLDPNTEGPEQIPTELTSVALAQQSIGWKHILKGRLSKEWITYMGNSIGSDATKTKNAITWATDIIKTIFNQCLALWKMRNEERHGHDYKLRREAEQNQAVREMEQLYELKGQIQPEDEWIFNIPIEQQKTKTAYVLQAFLSNYTPLVQGSYQTRLETG